MAQNKKPWYKRVWVWVGVITLVVIIGAAASGGGNTNTTTNDSAVDANASESKPSKWDVEAAYAKISNGMTKAQVEEATGQKSDNCTESDLGELGTSETCNYGNAFTDKAIIIVTFSNGEVSTKTKSTY